MAEQQGHSTELRALKARLEWKKLSSDEWIVEGYRILNLKGRVATPQKFRIYAPGDVPGEKLPVAKASTVTEAFRCVAQAVDRG